MRARSCSLASVLVAVVVIAGCERGCEIVPTNPLDPGTDPEFQRRATLSGSVRAVTDPDDDGTVPAPGPCDAVEGGDHGGFIVVLRGLADTGASIAGETQATNASGQFRFDDVPAGAYVVEVVRDGFALPDATELTLSFGEERNLGTVCAIKSAPPAPPLVSVQPPAIVDGDNQVPGTDAVAAVRVVAVQGVTFKLRETPEGDEPSRDEPIDGDVVVPLVLDALPAGDDGAVRRSWRVDIVGVDALGNVSEPASFLVVKDALAPLPPTFRVQVGRDRVQVQLGAAAARTVDGIVVDDAAATFRVGYAVVAPAAGDDACPFGVPDLDDDGVNDPADPVVHATFAVEGPSPLVVAGDTLTLSGLQAGTDLVLLAAAVDEAGNASCWSAPQAVRPDEITFVAQSSVVTDALGGAVASAIVDGAVAFARGAAGLVVIDRDGVSHVDDSAPAFDVDVLGEQLLVAGGALGLRVIALDDDGVPGAATTIALPGGASVDAVVARPGRALVGGDGGVFVVPLTGGTPAPLFDDGDVHDLVAAGDDLVVLHDGALLTISRYSIARSFTTGSAPATAVFFPRVAPEAMLLLDGQLWLAEGGLGVEVFDVDDDLSLVAQRVLPGSGFAARLTGFDDIVLVGVDGADDRRSGSVFALDHEVRLVGTHAFASARLAGVIAVGGGACAGVVDVAGSSLVCASTINAPLVDREVRFGGGDVIRVGVSGGQLLAASDDGDATVFSLAEQAAVAEATGADGDLLAAIVPGVGFLVGEQLLQHSGDVDVVTGLDFGFDVAFGAVHGDRVIVAGLDQGNGPPVATVVVGRLVESDTGFAVTDIERTVVDNVTAMPSVVVHRGRAFIATAPFGLLSVSVDGGAIDFVIDVGVDAGSGVGDVAFVGENVLVSGKKLVEGTLRERLFEVVDGVVDDNGVAESPADGIGGITALGGRLVVSTAFAGAFVLDGVDGAEVAPRAVLQVPTLSEVGQTLPTARGFVAADGGGGAVWVVLR